MSALSAEAKPVSQKLGGFEYWRKCLKEARLVVAPMVDQSELPWRLLSRRHGAELCFTPMFHASLFSKDATYRKENMVTCPEDRPLVVQFCANDPEILLKACEFLNPEEVDGVDLNLGCPQVIARRGNYGAFLQDDWDKIASMVKTIHQRYCLPISCKIRVFDDIEKTVRYATMLEEAGCQLLTVHGRNREQKGPKTGLASWKHIAAVKKAVSIPVFSNGNIQLESDIGRCMEETGADGVMAAEGNLHNPLLFQGKHPAVWEPAFEYLDLVDQYPCPVSFVRGHLFKILHHCLFHMPGTRDKLAKISDLSEFRSVVLEVKEKWEKEQERYSEDPNSWKSEELLYPPWIVQPYYRPQCDSSIREPKAVIELREGRRKRQHEDLDAKSKETGLSKRYLKKLARKDTQKPLQPRPIYALCACGNPVGTRCPFNSCRKCCKNDCREAKRNCIGHKLWFGNISERVPRKKNLDDGPLLSDSPRKNLEDSLLSDSPRRKNSDDCVS